MTTSSDRPHPLWLTVTEQLELFLTNSDLVNPLSLAFGPGIDQQLAIQLTQDLMSGENRPNLEIRKVADLNGAKGAFSGSTRTVYLAEEFVSDHSIKTVAEVLLEELGHFLDWQLNTVDSDGDEGAIFSALVRGETLTAQELQLLKTEDDWAIVNLDGKEIAIEQALVSGTSGNDLYELDLTTQLLTYNGVSNSASSDIEDPGGIDELTVHGDSFTLGFATSGQIGFGRSRKTLVIDINKDGEIDVNTDLTVSDFFANDYDAQQGNGFIETIGSLIGADIISLFIPEVYATPDNNIQAYYTAFVPQEVKAVVKPAIEYALSQWNGLLGISIPIKTIIDFQRAGDDQSLAGTTTGTYEDDFLPGSPNNFRAIAYKST
jgi:hypothetical protein